MTLVLRIQGLDRLDNGEQAILRLDRHGARIGRSPHMDWCLPDPNNHISASHCEIQYADDGYVLIDRSTNGTYLNRAGERITGPHRIANGDVISIGHYEIMALVEGEKGVGPGAGTAPASGGWGGWDSHVSEAQVGMSPSEWDRPAPRAAIAGVGAATGAWAPPKVEPAAPQASAWAQPEPPALQPSAWSSEPAQANAPSAADVWGRLADTNTVDWDRGGFGAQAPPAPIVPAAPSPAPSDAWGGGPDVTTPAPPAAPSPSAGAGGAEWRAFLEAAGVDASELKVRPGEAMAAAGGMIRRLMGGLVVMMEARARAKAQMGAQGTAFSFEGNNPIKFARSPDQALTQMLNPPERGFMPADRAIEDAFQDLQAHQLATLSAMQGALAATLARFSPTSIRQRAEMRGLLARILPSAREATLWQAYEREFEGVAKGSDEAFMDVFAKEFRDAYERVAADMKTKRQEL